MNVAIQGLPGPQEPGVPREEMVRPGPRDLQDPPDPPDPDLQGPDSLLRTWKVQGRVTCSSASAAEVPRVHLACQVPQDQRAWRGFLAPRGPLSRGSVEIQGHRDFRVWLDFQESGAPKERKAGKGLRVIVVWTDTASQDHPDHPVHLDRSSTCGICCRTTQKASSLSSEDPPGPRALKACLAELDSLAPEGRRETQAIQVSRGQQDIREKRENQE